ncbi:MAG: putative aspartyl aminopeptidase [Chlamydiales bacterium]|jgi:aspartyl aminopeptidase|nr:putative aspartyl aminopeptidase [Chlamydiales bacterium]
MSQQKSVTSFLNFLDHAPTAYHAVSQMQKDLNEAGFEQLDERQKWHIQSGKKYYTIRNGASLCAFITPEQAPKKMLIVAAHTDSPALKLKPNAEQHKGGMLTLGVEVYGGPLLSSWVNRDLAIAGKVYYLNPHGQTEQRLIHLKNFPVIIPQLAIHLDRKVNDEGLVLNKQEQLPALASLNASQFPEGKYIETLLKEELKCSQILSSDLYLTPLEPARLIGYEQELVSSYRIDNLLSTYAGFQALLMQPSGSNTIKIGVYFDHEEIGSESRQGAASPFLSDVHQRVMYSLGCDFESQICIKQSSLCLSVDGAHGLHPNHLHMHDNRHTCNMGKGIVIKTNAQQRYASDAQTIAYIQSLALQYQIPIQYYSHRADLPCGSTIGPITAAKTGIPTVDLGVAQLSMHSIREIAACQDYLSLIKLLEKAYLDADKSLITDINS